VPMAPVLALVAASGVATAVGGTIGGVGRTEAAS
jgi:hypothetical protein